MTHDHHHGHGHHPGHGQEHGRNDDHLAELLDLDAQVLHDFHTEVITWAGSLAGDRPHIVDLGAGSGTGTLALARRLPDARLTAVDVDETMLEHLRRRAADAGVADRVDTVRADLDGSWPELGPADLVWASASMHHMADPGHAVTQVRQALRPGGVFVIVELDGFPMFLTDPVGAALEQRIHAGQARMRAEAGMHMHEDWAARLKAAGFHLEGERRFDIDLRPPLPDAAGRYAQLTLQRARHRIAEQLDAADVATLDAVLASLPTRDDLTVRATRTVWIGRRP